MFDRIATHHFEPSNFGSGMLRSGFPTCPCLLAIVYTVRDYV